GIAARVGFRPIPDARLEILIEPLALIVHGGRRRRFALRTPAVFDVWTRRGALRQKLAVRPVPVRGLIAVVLVDPDLRVVVRLVEPLAVEILVRFDPDPAQRAVAIQEVLVPGAGFGAIGRETTVDGNRGVPVGNLPEVGITSGRYVAPARFSACI